MMEYHGTLLSLVPIPIIMRNILVFAASVLCVSLHAQFPQPHVAILPDPMAKEEGDRATQKQDIYYKGQVVRAQFLWRKDELAMRLSLMDGHTGETVAQAPELRKEWSPSTIRPDLLVSGDNAYLMETNYDPGTGVMSTIAWRYLLPSLEQAPNSIPVVSFTLENTPSSYNASFATGKFIQSDDGSKVAYVNYRLGSTDDEQIMLAQTFSSDMRPLNEFQVHKFHFAKDRIDMKDVKVSDQGSVFALMKEKTEKSNFTKKTANFTYRLYRFNGGEPMSQAVVLPASMTPSAVVLSMTESGPRMAGFFVVAETSTDDAVGYFIADYDPDLSKATPTADVFRFEQPVTDNLWSSGITPSPTGGSYLTAMTDKGGNNIVTSFIVIALGRDRSLLWKTEVPRNFNPHDDPGGFTPAIVEGRMHLLFTDEKANLPRYQNGEQLKSASKGEITMVASFDEQGRPGYEELNSPDLSLKPGNFGHPMGNDIFFTRVCPKNKNTLTPCGATALITFE